MLPITLNVSGRLAVVIGGGPVGRRKADALLAGGARVRLVSLDPRPADCAPDVTWLTEPYRRDHLAGAALAVAAATADVNRQVVADARALGVWVCSATEPEAGDFVLPAVVRRGRLTVAVSTAGAAPGLARRLARQLEGQFDAAFADWLDLLAELRPLALATVPDPEARRRLFEGWCDPAWLDRLRAQGADAVRTALLAELQALARTSDRPV